MKYKMYCIFAKESLDKINGIRGKLATQAGHAYLHAYWDAMGYPDKTVLDSSLTEDDLRAIWLKKRAQGQAYATSDRAYKITLVVDTVDELKVLQGAYKDVCGTHLVTDAGFTVFKEPTTTCLGLGPISEDNIGDNLIRLKTLT